ncbi:tetratricopeptide repeat protein, partial [Planctomycetota bacterium]|nr:tetratricopeptide repeat protein [Planctomycetota bacterium]
RGEYDQAEAHLFEAIALDQETGNRGHEGIALGNLAQVYRKTGQSALAMQKYNESLKILIEVKDKRFQGYVYCNRGIANQTAGNFDAAQADWRKGTALLLELKDSHGLERKQSEMESECKAAGVPLLPTP